ncbi:alanine racemase [Glaciibacter superstes]|uniref:alanine racemase n=1 Tax=Glaciibacter superstes TaxID=501023 RepID=UPI0003B569E3|nr:alanine racemase [Glaciibacter superstes]
MPASLAGTIEGPTGTIDLAAVRHNIEVLRRHAGPANVMAVVKADGYGHGAIDVARASVEAGATELGVATVGEALELRSAGIRAPVLCWLHAPDAVFRDAIAADVRLGISSVEQLRAAVGAATDTGRRAEIDLKLDTGLNRNGAALTEWPALMAEAVDAETAGSITVRGVFSHLACADEPSHPSSVAQRAAFVAGLDAARMAGLSPPVSHLANSAATLTRPDARFDLVRAGIAIYGLSPVPALGTFGLRPAMTLSAPVIMVKHLRAGDAVSYGHTWTAKQDTTVALLPIGYADGVPRALSGRIEVLIDGVRYPAVGTICMDQLVVDLGHNRNAVAVGSEAVLFGGQEPGRPEQAAPGPAAPTLQEWADLLGTVHYELATGIRGRVERRYIG